jgi:hypothetical protein
MVAAIGMFRGSIPTHKRTHEAPTDGAEVGNRRKSWIGKKSAIQKGKTFYNH